MGMLIEIRDVRTNSWTNFWQAAYREPQCTDIWHYMAYKLWVLYTNLVVDGDPCIIEANYTIRRLETESRFKERNSCMPEFMRTLELHYLLLTCSGG